MFNSSFINDALLLENVPPINSNFSLELNCYLRPANNVLFNVCYTIQILLLLPASTFILYRGIQLWRQRSASAATMSHSDCFTYHMVSMELINLLGTIAFLCGLNVRDPNFFLVHRGTTAFIWHGQTLFHLLTCVERYLAVVHPILYMRLKNQAGVRMRNILIICVWFLCFLAMVVFSIHQLTIVIFDICVLVFTLAVVLFCSASVLHFLIRPGPGALKGNRDRVDQSKQRALYTIVSIMGVLLLRFCWGVVWAFVVLVEYRVNCLMMLYGVYFQLPSSLVLPVLYLHRAGMFRICKKQACHAAEV